MKIITALFLSLLISIPSFALHRSTLPQSLQTKHGTPMPRYLSVTLPLKQAEEWIFANRNQLLQGKLTLTISRPGFINEIIIFDHGQFNHYWHDMKLGKGAKPNDVNFKFVSTKKYLTAPGDSLELEFTNVQNLFGASAYFSGILPKGFYTSYGRYSGLSDKPNFAHTEIKNIVYKLGLTPSQAQKLLKNLDHKAFLSNWHEQWSLKIVNQQGWLSPLRVPFKANYRV